MQPITYALVGSVSCIFVSVYIFFRIFISLYFCILYFFVIHMLHSWLCRASHHSCPSGISLRLLLIPQKTPHDDDDDDDDGDDIYIMMQCLFVCL